MVSIIYVKHYEKSNGYRPIHISLKFWVKQDKYHNLADFELEEFRGELKG